LNSPGACLVQRCSSFNCIATSSKYIECQCKFSVKGGRQWPVLIATDFRGRYLAALTGEAAAMVESSDYRTQAADRFAFFRGLGVARTFSTKTLSGIGTKEAGSAGSRIA